MRRDRLLWILLLVLFAALVVLVARHEEGEVAGLGLDQFARLVTLGSIGIVVGLSLLALLRGSRLAEQLQAAALWLVIALLLAVVYTYRVPLQQAGQRVLGELIPGYAVNVADARHVTVAVTRGADGQFTVRGAVNGAGLTLLVDTGASSVVLTHEAARAAGLSVSALTYDIVVETANGRARAASVLLDSIAVGGIVERRVPGLVAAPGALGGSLLGMSFLSRLDSFVFRGDQLILRGPAAER